MERTFKTEDLIRVAKRENNQMRSFLYVNPFQGKHVPVAPADALLLFKQLAEKAEAQFHNEKLLIIGFAETATAIGNAIAWFLPQTCAFLTTTRENVPHAEYLYFTESHSHATEQRLVVNQLEKWIRQTDRIVFAEDEVTTGNTIMKLITALRNAFPDASLQFGIVSILNSMTDERQNDFKHAQIPCVYYQRIPFGYQTDQTEAYSYEPLPVNCAKPVHLHAEKQIFQSGWNPRIAADMQQIRTVCRQFADSVLRSVPEDAKPLNLLVLGTEEFMFPGLLLGHLLEKHGHSVRFHATTRSPIEVSRHPQYPLHQRSPLVSFYEDDRRTFLYNLAKYDKVFVLTDAPEICPDGAESLLGALEQHGNSDVTIIQWSESD